MRRLVERDRNRPVDMPVEIRAGSVWAFGRAPHPVQEDLPPGADDNARADGPHELPPSVRRNRAQLVAPFADRPVPGIPRSHPDLAVELERVAVVDKRLRVGVENLQRGLGREPLVRERARQPVLPNLVHPLDLALRLRGVGEDERDAEEPEPLLELGDARAAGSEERRLVHVHLQRDAEAPEGAVEHVQVRPEALSRVKAAAYLHAAAVVQHVDEVQLGAAPAEEVVGRGVELPELPDAGALPPPRVRGDVGLLPEALDALRQGPLPDLRPVQPEAEAPVGLCRREGIREPVSVAVLRQHLAQEVAHLFRPSRHVVASRRPRNPVSTEPLRLCRKEGRAQAVKPRLADPEVLHRGRQADAALCKLSHRVAHMGDTQT